MYGGSNFQNNNIEKHSSHKHFILFERVLQKQLVEIVLELSRKSCDEI